MHNFTFKGMDFKMKAFYTKTIYAFDHCRVSRKSMLHGEKESCVRSPRENYFQVNERVKSPTILPPPSKVKCSTPPWPNSDPFHCLAGTDNAFPFYLPNRYVKDVFSPHCAPSRVSLRFLF